MFGSRKRMKRKRKHKEEEEEDKKEAPTSKKMKGLSWCVAPNIQPADLVLQRFTEASMLTS